MMNQPSKRLPELVPGLYRAKDAGLPGQPLSALLRALGTELDALDDAIRALLDDHFVERASEEALRRLAELVGARLFGSDLRVTRAVVARSVAWRRRKGTLATLEEILATTTGWGVDVDEGFRSLAVTLDLRHPLPTRGRTADLRDPIALADPLSEITLTSSSEALVIRDGESVDDALRRIGRADAGRHAAMPRTVDLRGWARPDALAVRTTRLVAVPHEGVSPGPLESSAEDKPTCFSLDPLGRAAPLLWDAPLEGPERVGALTAAHEPDLAPPSPPRTATALLTPTALAAAPDAVVSSGALRIALDGVPLLGPDPVPELAAPLAAGPLGLDPALRFVEAARPSPGDAWQLDLVARPDDPSGDDVLLLSSDGASVTYASPLPAPSSSSLVLQVKRLASTARCRTATGWVAVTAADLLRAGPAMTVTVGSTSYAARVGIDTEEGPLLLQLVDLSTHAEVGRFAIDSIPATDPADLHSVADGDTIVILRPSPVAGSDPLREVIALHKIVVTTGGGATTLTVSDIAMLPSASGLSPAWRSSPAAMISSGELIIHGGVDPNAADGLGPVVLDDTWSAPISGGAWVRLPFRNPRGRFGATILAWNGDDLLLGGCSARPPESAPIAGPLDPTVWLIDPSAARPTWRALPSLPIESGRPGQLIARVTTAGTIEALVWADRTRPTLFTLDENGTAWTPGAIDEASIEGGAPNPPAGGAGVFVGDEVFVFGARPLPPSEIVFSLAGRRRLAFLPELDLSPIAGQDTLELAILGDGSTAHPESGQIARAADGFAIGVPGRLDRRRFVLRQRTLGAAVEPQLASPPPSGVIGLDPRIGRVVLPRDLPAGALTVSYRAGRGSAIGAGAMPPARAPLPSWLAPGEEAPAPPDLRAPAAPLTAWVSPESAGLTVRRRGVDVPAFATLDQALAASASAEHAVLGILGSPRFAPAWLTPDGASVSIVAEPNAAPLLDVSADQAPMSLVVLPRPDASASTELWLAGLWLAGTAYVMLTRGDVDLRWCTLAPGGPALIFSGSELEDIPRASAHDVTVELRLYGCVVGGVELPPWVRLVAAGCTFDGGDGGLAISAPGSPVRLRQCTLRGGVEAGALQASSCAFAGDVRVSRPDEGFIRHSLLRRGPSLPRLYRALDRTPSFVSVDPASPSYLVLADSDQIAASAGELGRLPGAHDQRSDRARELVERTRLSMPMTLVAHHADRAVNDLARMNRSPQ